MSLYDSKFGTIFQRDLHGKGVIETVMVVKGGETTERGTRGAMVVVLADCEQRPYGEIGHIDRALDEFGWEQVDDER